LGLSIAYYASRIVPISRGGKISIPGHRLMQTTLEAKERARPLPIYTVSLKLRFLHSQMMHARRLRRNIIGRLITSLIQEEHAPAETTILDEILLADHWMEVTQDDYQKCHAYFIIFNA
jgi:hypothetical protein